MGGGIPAYAGMTGRDAPRPAVPSPAGFAGVLSPYKERRIRALARL